jgi:hypothetical protein
MFDSVSTFVVESPLSATPSTLIPVVWVPVTLIVAALLWIGWKERGKTPD